jgi:hypothetical protein
MTEIKLKIKNDPDKARDILIEVLETEAMRLNYSLQLSKKRLIQYERKYKVTSDTFINEWAAEDLEGEDIEYVEWAGEFKLASLINERLTIIKGIEHASP